MFKEMNTFMLFVLFFGLTNCEDWCPFITPNDTYEELGITRNWTGANEKDVDYVMYNRVGNEWLFNITGSGNYSPQSLNIEMIEGSVRNGSDPNVIYRFAMYVKRPVLTVPLLNWKFGDKSLAANIRLLKTV